VNRHPGIELVAVPLPLRNGLTIQVRLLKLPDRYIGPQGEEYAERPSAEVLSARYGM
jgi:hypothetical protein